MEPSLLNRIGYRIFHNGLSMPQWEQRKRRRQYDAEKARVLQQRPPMLPSRRKALSIASVALHQQRFSRLFTDLPLEIRQQIYELVLGGNVLHLINISKRIVHKKYPVPDSSSRNGEKRSGLAMRDPPEVGWICETDRDAMPDQFSSTSLSMLCTCHAIYAEAVPILYSANIFSMSSPLVLLYLQDFTLLRQRFSQIQHLQLHWLYASDGMRSQIHAPYDFETWDRFWSLVATMDLKSLGAWIKYIGKVEDCDFSSEWVRPMLRVHGVKRVEVRVESIWSPFEWQRRDSFAESISKVWTEPESTA